MWQKIKNMVNYLERDILSVWINMKYFVCIHRKNWQGIRTTSDDWGGEKLIISLTTYPARLYAVVDTIKSLLLQTHKADQIVLWLSYEEFPAREKELPPALLEMRRWGLTIGWCHNMKSYNKLIPALQRYPEAVIVTVDDDALYFADMVKNLYQSYREAPDMVYSHRIAEFYLEDGNWKSRIATGALGKRASFLYCQTGVAGVLYPPHILSEEVMRNDIFEKICTTNDDIWFWFMAVMNQKKICVPEHTNRRIFNVRGTQKGPTLRSINDHGEKLYYVQLGQMLAHYPSVKSLLEGEYMMK